jgi:hypothetical protein
MRFNPSNNSWSRISTARSISSARQGMGFAVSQDGMLYVFGGYGHLAHFSRYDLRNSRWAQYDSALKTYHSQPPKFVSAEVSCGPGYFASNESAHVQEGSGLCLPCWPGSFSMEGATTCTRCSDGTFSNSFRESSCSLCPPAYTWNIEPFSAFPSPCDHQLHLKVC